MERFRLTYHIAADRSVPLAQLHRELTGGFVALHELDKWIDAPHAHHDERISISEIQPGVIALELDIVASDLDLEQGGVARLLTLLFGNPFRSHNISSVVLTSITPSEDIRKILPGVAADPLIAMPGPVLSVPFPMRLSADDQLALAEVLVDGGVDILTDSPLGGASTDAMRAVWHYLDSRKGERIAAYYVNGTVTLTALPGLLSEVHANSRVAGVRLCPYSMGLNTCQTVKARGIRIYGYNLLPLLVDPRNSVRLSYYAAAMLLRLVGCDLINVGLDSIASDISSAGYEVVNATRKDIVAALAPAVPMFTGSITPRRAYHLIRRYGNNIGLHVKKPLLRSGRDFGKLRENLRAYQEAIRMALGAESLDERIAEEGKDSKYLRLYESRFGRGTEE